MRYRSYEAGAELYRDTGVALPEDALRGAESADAILLGAMGLPSVRYPNGTEVRRISTSASGSTSTPACGRSGVLAGAPTPLADPRARQVDCVLVRESTEGLFARAAADSRREGNDVVFDTMRISRDDLRSACSDSRLRWRESGAAPDRPGPGDVRRQGQRPAVDGLFPQHLPRDRGRVPGYRGRLRLRGCGGAPVGPLAMGIRRARHREHVRRHPLRLRAPALMGGMGMAPSPMPATRKAVFQPCHGTAPDIAGQGLANPTAMFLSAAMMLDWLGDRARRAGMQSGGAAAHSGGRACVRGRNAWSPTECGGSAGTAHHHGARAASAAICRRRALRRCTA